MTATHRQHRLKRILGDWIPALFMLLLMLVARSTLADHYHVPSGSMEYTLMPGDHVVVNKAAYGLRIPFTKQVFALRESPRRGEVVILDAPNDGVRLIKRVVATSGDRVTLRNGHLRINGRPLANSSGRDIEYFGERSAHLNLRSGGGPEISEMIVPDGHVLLLGDHRGGSRDGRFFGTVPVDELYGRASAVFWRRSEGPTWKPL